VFPTASNFTSPALSLAHTIQSTLRSSISSLLKESHWYPKPSVKILRFRTDTIVNINYILTMGYASGKWLTIPEFTLWLQSSATAFQSILTASLFIWKLVDLSTNIHCQHDVEWVLSGKLPIPQWTRAFWTYKLHCTALCVSARCTALLRTNYLLHWLTLYKRCTGSTVRRSVSTSKIYTHMRTHPFVLVLSYIYLALCPT